MFDGWDGVTAALPLLSHLDGDALNVALLVPETQRVLSGVLVRAFRRPGDDPSVFDIELETLARRAFVDINTSIQLQLVRD